MEEKKGRGVETVNRRKNERNKETGKKLWVWKEERWKWYKGEQGQLDMHMFSF